MIDNFHNSSILFRALICLLAVINVSAIVNPIEVKGAGIYTMKRNDIGMVFYVTVYNRGTEIVSLVTNMVECCEAITDDDTDCEFMKLMGGHMGTLAPGKSRNVTLIFPNLYLHNRRGECLVQVWYRTPKNESFDIRHRIPFDTSLYRDRAVPSMRNYYSLNEVRNCQSPDQDPLDNCEPVSCHLKYAGSRSYFNPINQRCQAIPICMSDPEKELPDIAYVPLSNTCRDLEQAITEDDVKFLTRNEVGTKWKSNPPPRISNLRCHHGHINNQTGLCVCDAGWTSAAIDGDQFNPSTMLYHMCTIQETPDIAVRAKEIFRENMANYAYMLILVSIFYILLFYCTSTFILVNDNPPANQNNQKETPDDSQD
ncbi:hypothetical protein LSTR_LSTR001878 [Laodelphax striatellus]|uniref:Uncharacterized protein n=1 Tax=Laodelphax striatellus TaxID=195883 RepID=A0A482WFY6_LAOST|nr:hypothetical protein LSTR_LSTR001878 [Laodelphax striatellus]